jgi:hypothetical protein
MPISHHSPARLNKGQDIHREGHNKPNGKQQIPFFMCRW